MSAWFLDSELSTCFITQRYKRLSTAPWCFLLYPLLVSFHLQIAFRKVRNFRIGVNKLVGKVLINLLCNKFFYISHLCNQHNLSMHLPVIAV